MRCLIFRPLVMMLTFMVGLFVTFLFTFMGDALSQLADDPDADIPAICRSESTAGFNACAQPNMREIEEYAVYSTLLMQLYKGGHSDRVLIRDHTSVDGFDYKSHDNVLEETRRQLPVMQGETFFSFIDANEYSHPFDNRLRLPGASRFVNAQQIEGYFSEGGGGWNAFNRDYPHWGGFITFSKVGFNRDMNQALVYFSSVCGDTCGAGELVFLVKEGVVWRIKGTAVNWIS
jgi:hypothetical protein